MRNVVCVQVGKCHVIFEPYGAEYILEADDVYKVEIAGPGTGEVDIVYGPGAVSITPWVGGDYVRVTNRSGEELEGI